MSFELLHFKGSEAILREKGLTREVQAVMEYLDDVLYGSFYRRELLRQALDEMDWRNGDDLAILDGRRYRYKGMRKGIALEGNFSSYEYIQEALFRLQVGFDKGRIDMGIVLVTAERSEKSHLGTTRELLMEEIEMLHPTISLPVMVALFDLGKRTLIDDGNEQMVPVEPGPSDEWDGTNDRMIVMDDEPPEGEIPPEITQPKITAGKRKRGSKVKERAAISPEEPLDSPMAVNQ